MPCALRYSLPVVSLVASPVQHRIPADHRHPPWTDRDRKALHAEALPTRHRPPTASLEALVFDTRAIVRRLTDAGLSEKQADALTDALREAAEHAAAGVDVEALATKADLRAEVVSLEARLYRAMAGGNELQGYPASSMAGMAP